MRKVVLAFILGFFLTADWFLMIAFFILGSMFGYVAGNIRF